MSVDIAYTDERQHPNHQQLLKSLKSGEYSFIDLGCGTGESIAHCENQFKRGKGIGFDISPSKIAGAIDNGYPAIFADVTKTDFDDDLVDFCTMMDFLEHLRTEEAAVAILEAAGKVAKDFLFIRHPSFEDRDYLESLELKLDWTDWSGHRNRMLLSDFHRVFASLGWSDYIIIPQKQILSSDHPAIVPVTAATDTVRYNATVHGSKRFLTFNRPLWTQFDIYVRLSPDFLQQDWLNVVSTSDQNSINELLSKENRRLFRKLSASKILPVEQSPSELSIISSIRHRIFKR
ncbi:class I SAM-dependent methyltransferase [Aeoliella sp.]|uniref:class I SAM-dependent methyltransferase n=1 Tax=Aeoliella sp. TaxID=2795800 RepID=UPI003CCBDD3D